MDIRDSVNDVIIGMIMGNFDETFERFYDDEIVLNVDGHGESIGKEVSKERRSEYFDGLGSFRYAKATSVIVDGHKAAIEWDLEFVKRDGTSFMWNQVAFQTWKNGKIIREVLYHK